MKNKIRKFLVPVDFSPYAGKTLRAAASLCAQKDAQLILLYVIDTSAYLFPENRLTPTLLPELVEVANSSLKKQADTVSQTYGVPTDARVVCGDTAEEILHFIQHSNVDVVVPGLSKGTGPHDSIARLIAARASCQVLMLGRAQKHPSFLGTASLVRTKIALYERGLI